MCTSTWLNIEINFLSLDQLSRSSLWPDNYSLGVLVFSTSSYLDINIFRVSGCIETMSGDNKANSIDMAYWNWTWQNDCEVSEAVSGCIVWYDKKSFHFLFFQNVLFSELKKSAARESDNELISASRIYI